LSVATLLGQAGGVEERLPVSRPLRLAEGDEQLQALGLVRCPLGGVEKLEGVAVVRHRLVVGGEGEGTVPRPGGVGNGLARRGRRGGRSGEVVRQGGEVVVKAAGVESLDGLGHLAVQDDKRGSI
jgi:hypothetical protein